MNEQQKQDAEAKVNAARGVPKEMEQPRSRPDESPDRLESLDERLRKAGC